MQELPTILLLLRRAAGLCLLALLAMGTVVAADAQASPNLKLERVDFKNNYAVTIDHRNNVKGEDPLRINEYGENNEVEYQVSSTAKFTKKWPVAYLRQTVIKLIGQFGVDANAREFLEKKQEGNVTLMGEATIGGTAIVFKKELTPAEVEKQMKEHNTFLTTGEISANNALPNKVIYELVTITWKWKAKEKGASGPFEQEIGQSKHNFYLTFTQPLSKVTNFLTVLDLDTQGIEKEGVQPPSEAQVIKGIWSQFTPRQIGLRWYNVETGTLNRGGVVLQYYQNENTVGLTLAQAQASQGTECNAEETQALLEKAQGQCGSWGQILSYALGIEGIKSKTLNAESNFAAGPCKGQGTCELLVKNWEFVGEGSKEEEFPYMWTKIKDLAGIEGQGTQNPPSLFQFHVIVEAGQGTNKLYDPSYGTGPFEGAERLKKIQQESIAGFCSKTETKCLKATAGAEQLTTKERESFTT